MVPESILNLCFLSSFLGEIKKGLKIEAEIRFNPTSLY